MRYSYNKLKQLSGTEKSPKELSELLIMRAFEVESIERLGHGLENVVVGLVHSVEKHPNADKLNVAQVETDVGVTRQIVCGAPNLATGQKVAVALPGAKLPGDVVIKESKIRDVESQGMICGADELGFGTVHRSILVLPEDAPIGTLFSEYAELEDVILDIKILPDRGVDALSYRGLAREIAALEGRRIAFEMKELSKYFDNQIEIKLPSPKCLRYAGFLFESVEQGSTPLPLCSFLLRNGLRSISTPVDITNLFLLEYGQPMHAFDADTIRGKVIVRDAEEGETLELLNGDTILLTVQDLVIADEEKVLALAGVMGGMSSSITEKTKRIFLEIAIFEAVTVRRSRVRHNLQTDAAHRYERGLDPNISGETFAEVAEMFERYCGAEVAGFSDVYPNPVVAQTIALPLNLPEKVLGVPIGKDFIQFCLEAHGCTVTGEGDALQVIVPTRRRDLRDAWNLVEEIGRTNGYENIPAVAPVQSLSPVEENREKSFERSVKHFLAAAGFDEIMSYSFYGPSDAEKFSLSPSGHLALANPLSSELSLMRPSVLVTLLMKARENLRYTDMFSLFEWGSAYNCATGDGIHEEKELALVFSAGKNESPFSLFKGKVETLLDFVHHKNVTFELLSEGAGVWHPIRSARIMANGKQVGTIGEIAPYILSKWGIKRRLVAAQFSVPLLSEHFGAPVTATALPKFPFVIRDISLFIPNKKITVMALEKVLRNAGAPLLQGVELFDRFEKEDGVSIAFHLSFGSMERTHTQEEIQMVFDAMVAAAQVSFAAELNQ